MKGDYDRAIADYDNAIQIDPKNATAYYGRAITFATRNDDDGAIADYNESPEVGPVCLKLGPYGSVRGAACGGDAYCCAPERGVEQTSEGRAKRNL